jgi:predicted TIM-barrel fold metal-dependent hydrolase
MIIDSHAHLKHGDARKTAYTARELIRAMDGAGIARSVVFAMSTTTARSVQMVLDAVRQYPDRLIPYVYALPRYDRPVLPEIEEAITVHGCKGIKMHLGECTVEDYVAGPVLELAGRHGVPCLIDFSGRLGPCQSAVAAHPHTLILICHLGKYLSQDVALIDAFIRVAEEHPNALLDVSGVAMVDKITEAAHRVGAERILFGTDGPHSVQDDPLYVVPDTIDYARQEIAKIESLALSQAEKDAILGGNIASLLRL